MQERLLRSNRFVRLVSAPTGSGKSYAFMRAVLEEEAQVLFIVPTKRLLQNLFEDAREQAHAHLRGRGWNSVQSSAWIGERIVEWSGNQAGDGRESLAATRVRQMLAGAAHSGGRVIFAIPEVVVRLISGVRISGASAINPFFYVRRFDHIVFDEFHTIDDRSFGLASLMSLLAVTERQGRVSLLSATPIDVTGILERAGVSPDDVDRISEEIVDGHPHGHRPIHGNVSISLHPGSLPDLIGLNIEAVRASIGDRRTVIVIYDSLRCLQRDEPKIRAILREGGIGDERVLAINSIDDSGCTSDLCSLRICGDMAGFLSVCDTDSRERPPCPPPMSTKRCISAEKNCARNWPTSGTCAKGRCRVATAGAATPAVTARRKETADMGRTGR